jgi:acyl-coenzyme A thioesterase PaaI-like protein
MTQHVPELLRLYRPFGSNALGRRVFSAAFCLRVPYFGSISPRFEVLEPGRCEVTLPFARKVQNHLGSVHAIAMCNAAELVGGSVMEATIEPHLRWIPVGMTVEYTKIARSDLRARCVESSERVNRVGELPIHVELVDPNGDVVFTATIRMRVSEKKAAPAAA